MSPAGDEHGLAVPPAPRGERTTERALERLPDRGEGAPFADAASFVAAEGSLVSRLLAGAFTLLLAGAFAWAAWAQVEEVVRATGRTEPAGQVRLLNHPHGGRVAELPVHEGSVIAAGAVVLRLDGAAAAFELVELEGRWRVAEVAVARLESEAWELPFTAADTLVAARPDLVDSALLLMRARAAARTTREATLAEAVEGRRSELATVEADRARIMAGLVPLEEQLAAIRELAARGLYPKLRRLQAEQQLANALGERAASESAVSAARAALAEAQSRRDSLAREWTSTLMDELAGARAERDRLAEQVAAQRTLLESLVLRAPVGGTVLDLAVAAVGQAVPANQPILKIVPTGEALMVEARIKNEDIGRVRVGMAADVKVRAYDYLRHGKLRGTVLRIAADATAEPETGLLSFPVTIGIDRQQLGTFAGDRAIVAGMLVDIDLKAGERTILSYFTDRVWKLREQAFTEG